MTTVAAPLPDPHVRRLATGKILLRERRIMAEVFGFELCEIGIWDMLLELYCAHHERRTAYLWSLCTAAHIPASTAHRRLGALIESGLVVRRSDTRDRRRTEVSLSGQGLEMFDLYMARIAPFKP